MTIMVTGGGSGGHITPVLAVASALKKRDASPRVIYIGQKGDGLADVPLASPWIDRVIEIPAGKLRRYHGEGLKQLLDIHTVALNIRDVFRTLNGFIQALREIRRAKPDCIFIKGGFVGVPVGLAAALLKVPFITHDSDAIPGLANRIIGRWATYHAVALPKQLYPYPAYKTFTVGVPVSEEYSFVTEQSHLLAKAHLGLKSSDKVMLITGGGLGAKRINDASIAIMSDLLTSVPDLHIFHTVGRQHEVNVSQEYEKNLNSIEQGRVHVIGYTNELYTYSAAADLIIMRAGATAIAEFAVQGRACLLVPNPFLTGGHQLKNAKALQDASAVSIIDDETLSSDLPLYLSTIEGLIQDESARKKLESNLHAFAHDSSADEVVDLIGKVIKK